MTLLLPDECSILLHLVKIYTYISRESKEREHWGYYVINHCSPIGTGRRRDQTLRTEPPQHNCTASCLNVYVVFLTQPHSLRTCRIFMFLNDLQYIQSRHQDEAPLMNNAWDACTSSDPITKNKASKATTENAVQMLYLIELGNISTCITRTQSTISWSAVYVVYGNKLTGALACERSIHELIIVSRWYSWYQQRARTTPCLLIHGPD